MKKKKRDLNQTAFDIVSKATDAVDGAVSAAARALSKLGASKGGKARAESLSKTRRREIAQKAAKKRWSKQA